MRNRDGERYNLFLWLIYIVLQAWRLKHIPLSLRMNFFKFIRSQYNLNSSPSQSFNHKMPFDQVWWNYIHSSGILASPRAKQNFHEDYNWSSDLRQNCSKALPWALISLITGSLPQSHQPLPCLQYHILAGDSFYDLSPEIHIPLWLSKGHFNFP